MGRTHSATPVGLFDCAFGAVPAEPGWEGPEGVIAMAVKELGVFQSSSVSQVRMEMDHGRGDGVGAKPGSPKVHRDSLANCQTTRDCSNNRRIIVTAIDNNLLKSPNERRQFESLVS